MDLSLPLRSLIPSLDSDVLAVLAGTESSLGVTQIARLAARGSRQGISAVLDRLTEHGLVLAHPTNRGHVFQLNREHVLALSLLSALDARSRVMEILDQEIRQLEPGPAHVSVFGSFARGEGGADSDIDLLVVTPSGNDPEDERWAAQLGTVEDQVFAATGNRLEVMTLSLGDLRAAVVAGEPLIGSLISDSIRLIGRPFIELVEAEGGIR